VARVRVIADIQIRLGSSSAPIQVVKELPEEWVRQIFQQLQKLPSATREPLRQDVCIALLDAGWQQNPRMAFGASLLECAIQAHSRRGELDQARAGLALEPGAATLANLALDQRNRALWPDIDRRGAGGFRKSLDRDVERAAAVSRAAPQDALALTAYVRALRAVGRHDEAIAASKAIATDKAKIEALGDHGFWLVNEYALALEGVGRIDEAVAAYDGLLTLGIDNYPGLTAIAINRAELLDDLGRHQQALQAITELDGYADKLNSYGKMWLWAEHACALHALSRDDEAKPFEASMGAKPDDNWGAMVRDAACRKDTSAVANIVIKRLNNEESRSDGLSLFLQFRGKETLLPFEKTIRGTIDEALKSKPVQDEFQKFGRVVTYAGTRSGWSKY
jgi:tetratricopeptide (TPR) repeat protein